jgi:electron transport complex protein RnfE
VPLIIVNCIIICRCEVCASKQNVWTALWDSVGNSIGFALSLSCMATVRELLSTGSWFGIEMFWKAGTDGEKNRWSLMALPPGAFLTFGTLMGLWNWVSDKIAGRTKTA